MNVELMLSLFILLPLVAASLLPFLSRLHKRLVPAVVISLMSLLSLLSIRIITFFKPDLSFELATQAKHVYSIFGVDVFIDSFSALLMLLISVVGAAASLYAVSYMARHAGRTKFYIVFLIMLSGMYGLVMAGDLFSLYVYLEVAAISSFILVAFSLEWDGVEAAFKYLLLSALSTVSMLVGIGLLFYRYGTLDYAQLPWLTLSDPLGNFELLAVGLLIVGFALKAALVPFHAWLPDAHPSAPAPVSALLSGVLIKVLGVFALVRVIFTLFHRADVFLDLLALLGILSILLGAVLALAQWDYKRLLAYSSISQVGYIILGIGIGTPLGVMGALLHMLNHGVFKSLLFLNAGAVEYRLGTRDIREMGGLENRMPLTSTSAIFGFLSLAGVPPLNGFWSKLFIILAAIQVGANGYAVIAALASVITLGYALKVMKQAFFGELNTKWENVREIPWTMGGALVFLSILCVVMGLGIGVLLDELVIPAVDMLFL